MTGAGAASSPAVANGVVYLGGFDDSLYAFGLAGGAQFAVHRPDPTVLRPSMRLQARKAGS